MLAAPVELSSIDRTLLVEQRVLGRTHASLIVVTAPAQTGAVAQVATAAGGSVVTRDDALGYLYASVPLDAVEKFLTTPGIDAVQVACNPVRADTADATPAKPKKNAPPPGPFLALENPYTAEYATQASVLKLAHPTFDGRGVTVAFVEPADPLLPSMKCALDLRGAPVPKFAIYSWGRPEPFKNSVADADGSWWQEAAAATPTADGHIRAADRDYKLPTGITAREWRVCVRRPSSWEQDKPNRVALWAVDLRRLWFLDTGKDDFSGAPSAAVAQPWFAVVTHDYNANDQRDVHTWVFVVDEEKHRLAFGPTYTAHPAMVASLIAGSHFLGSEAGGVAPASQLAVFQEAESKLRFAWATIETAIAALRHPAVDFVESSRASGDTARGGGPRVYGLLMDRLVRETGRAFVHAESNYGPKQGGADAFNSSGSTFSIGGFVPQETWRATYGFEPSSNVTPAEYTGWGPASDGALKPDFLALTHTLCEASYKSAAFEEPFGLYSVSGGTSAAAPNAAGHVALLVSAAKQNGIKHDASRLRAAIATTAKFLPGVEARVQGHGLIQIADAWTALQRADHWEPPEITTVAPVVGCEPTSDQAESHPGRGLFEMRGWAPGASGTRTLRVTRTSGPAIAQTYQLRWRDNSGAFSTSLTELSLPLNQSVAVPVAIKVGASGSYSAILDFINPTADLVAHSVMTTIVTAEPLTKANGYAASLQRVLERPGNCVVWFDVPPGLTALKMRVARADHGDPGSVRVQDPTRRLLPFNPYGSEVFRRQDEAKEASVKGEKIQVFENPVPGVWQFWIQESSLAPSLRLSTERLKPTNVTWEVTGYRVAASEGTATTGERTVAFTDEGAGAGELKTKVVAQGLGSRATHDVALQPGLAAKMFEVEVPDGASRLEVTCEHDDATALVGLYLYKASAEPGKISGDKTALVYHDPSRETNKRFVIDAPKPGKYVIALDPLCVPAGGLKVRCRDAFFHPLFGSVHCDETESVLAPSATKTAAVTWTAAAVPAIGRQLVAEVALTSPRVGYSKAAVVNGTTDENKLEIVPVPLATHVLTLEPRSPKPSTSSSGRKTD